MFGGCPKFESGKTDDTQQKLAKTTVLEFGEQNQEYITERVCNSHMVSTPAIWIG